MEKQLRLKATLVLRRSCVVAPFVTHELSPEIVIVSSDKSTLIMYHYASGFWGVLYLTVMISCYFQQPF